MYTKIFVGVNENLRRNLIFFLGPIRTAGEEREEYGEALVSQLAVDLTRQFSRGSASRTSGRCALFTWPEKRGGTGKVNTV
jgi:hypothetical protein